MSSDLTPRKRPVQARAKVRIQRVTPRTAQGEVTGEDLGIDRGAIVRRVEQ